MKLAIFERNNSKVKWSLFLETVRLNIEKGNAVFIGNKKQIKEIKDNFTKVELGEQK